MYNPELKTFLVVAECGSFQKAAERLFMSPPAVMKQINQFEAHTGLRLFNRTSRGVTLTEAGKVVQEGGRKLIVMSDSIISEAMRSQRPDKYEVRVGSSLLYPYTSLFNLWSSLSSRYPEISFSIVPFNDLQDGFTKLGKSLDVMVGAFDSDLKRQFCQFLQLGVYYFCVAVPLGHHLCEKKRLDLSDLHGEELYMMPPGNSPVNDQVRQVIEKEHPQIILREAPYHYDLELFNHCASERKLLLSLSGWQNLHPALKSIPLNVPQALPYGIIYSLKANRETIYFLNLIREVM